MDGRMDGLLRSIKSCVHFSIEFLIEFFFGLSSSSFTPFSSSSIITITITNHQSPPLSSFVVHSVHLVDPGVAVFGGVG